MGGCSWRSVMADTKPHRTEGQHKAFVLRPALAVPMFVRGHVGSRRVNGPPRLLASRFSSDRPCPMWLLVRPLPRGPPMRPRPPPVRGRPGLVAPAVLSVPVVGCPSVAVAVAVALLVLPTLASVGASPVGVRPPTSLRDAVLQPAQRDPGPGRPGAAGLGRAAPPGCRGLVLPHEGLDEGPGPRPEHGQRGRGHLSELEPRRRERRRTALTCRRSRTRSWPRPPTTPT